MHASRLLALSGHDVDMTAWRDALDRALKSKVGWFGASLVLVAAIGGGHGTKINTVEIPELATWQRIAFGVVGLALLGLGARKAKSFTIPMPVRAFVQRRELLEAIESRLKAQPVVPRLLALTGPLGVGKTQVARSYAATNKRRLRLGWAFDASTEASLRRDMLALAHELDLANGRDPYIAARLVFERLADSSNWLLIYENATPARVREWLPVGGNGTVLLCSTDDDWGNLAPYLQVPPMSDHDGAQLLLARTGQNDMVGAQRLSHALGGLPLALEQAAQYVASTRGRSIEQYLDELAREPFDPPPGWAPADYPRSVGAALSLSFKQVRREAKTAAGLLEFSAFLGSTRVPKSLLLANRELLPSSLRGFLRRGRDLDIALKALRRHSIIEEDIDSFSCHPLFQLAVRSVLRVDERQVWAATAVLILDKAFPDEVDAAAQIQECMVLLPHAVAALGLLGSPGGQTPGRPVAAASVRLLFKCGCFLANRISAPQAQNYLVDAVQLTRKLPIECSDIGLPFLRSIVCCLLTLRFSAEAAYLLELCHVADLPRDHMQAELLTYLGIASFDSMGPNAARIPLTEACSSFKELNETTTAEAALAYGFLSLVSDDSIKGLARLEDFVVIAEQTPRRPSWAVAEMLLRLGVGRLVAAEQLRDRDPRFSLDLQVWRKEAASGLKEARRCLEDASNEWEALYFPGSWKIASAASALGAVLEYLDELPQAAKALERARTIYAFQRDTEPRLVVGHEAPLRGPALSRYHDVRLTDYVNVSTRLGHIKLTLGEDRDASEILRRTIEFADEAQAADPKLKVLQLPATLVELGQALLRLDQPTLAMTTLERARSLLEISGARNFNLLITLRLLSDATLALGDTQNAMNLSHLAHDLETELNERSG